MLTCDILEVGGLLPSVKGMRNPKNSWDRSDSSRLKLGNNDLKLMNQLFKAGTEHRKYDRMITVWLDITAPLYWWKEFDTYKIGTVANSCSTMHKIQEKEFTLDDFSHDKLDVVALDTMDYIIAQLEYDRRKYLKTKDKTYWWRMIKLLPSSYNQKRTVMLNYEVVARIIEQRTNHKLDEWNQLIEVLQTLPYLHEIMEGLKNG